MDACLRFAGLRWNVPYSLLHGIAWCESRLQADARNPTSSAAGLFQWLGTSWASTPYAAHSRLVARWSAAAAAWAIHTHGTSPWYASRGCWG